MTTKPRWETFECFIIKQSVDGPEIAVFAIDAYTLQELSTVTRIADGKKGYQRIINPAKQVAIKRYVEIAEAVLPTGIVLATGDKSGFVKIEDRQSIGTTGKMWSAKLRVKHDYDYKPFLVIDGQHRLYGIISSKITPYPVPVTVLLHASNLVQMANFAIINNKATRIPAAHLNELRGLMFKFTKADEEKLNSLMGQLGVTSLTASSLVSELNGAGMIFEEILDFPSNKSGFVSSNTLRQLIEKSRESGFLNYLPDDDDDDLRAYDALWQGIRKKFLHRWNHEVNLFHQFSKGKVKRKEVKTDQKLLHSGSIFILGKIADKELASSSYRKKWLEADRKVITELVQKEIFGNVSDRFWDSKGLRIDNTAKGRSELQKLLEEEMV